jgi:hypothetical protein
VVSISLWATTIPAAGEPGPFAGEHVLHDHINGTRHHHEW